MHTYHDITTICQLIQSAIENLSDLSNNISIKTLMSKV